MTFTKMLCSLVEAVIYASVNILLVPIIPYCAYLGYKSAKAYDDIPERSKLVNRIEYISNLPVKTASSICRYLSIY